MLFRGILITEASGKIDDVVAATNRGTPYFRSLGPAPTTFTTPQEYAQQGVTDAVSQWKAMSAINRERWEGYARSRRRDDRLGNRRPRTGFNEYVRWAAPRNQSNHALGFDLAVTDNPQLAPEATLDTIPSFELTASDVRAAFTFDDTAPWCSTNDAAVLIFAGRNIPATRNRPYGGFALAAKLQGNASAPITSPQTIALLYAPVSGEKVWCRFRLTTLGHGMSAAFQAKAVCP